LFFFVVLLFIFATSSVSRAFSLNLLLLAFSLCVSLDIIFFTPIDEFIIGSKSLYYNPTLEVTGGFIGYNSQP